MVKFKIGVIYFCKYTWRLDYFTFLLFELSAQPNMSLDSLSLLTDIFCLAANFLLLTTFVSRAEAEIESD